MANVYLDNRGGTYTFTLIDSIMDSVGNWSISPRWTDRNDEEYAVTKIGKDGSGFYYEYAYYTLNSSNQRVLNYIGKKYWRVSDSGTFQITFTAHTYPTEIMEIDETIYDNCIRINNIIKHVDYERALVSISDLLSYTDDLGYVHYYIEYTVTPKPRYVLQYQALLNPYVTVPEVKSDNIYPCPDVEDKDASHNSTYPKTIEPYGMGGVKITWEVQLYIYTQLSYEGYIETGLFGIDQAILRDEYNVTRSLSNITASNTSNRASTSSPYTNTLTADMGYTMDDVDVVVTMGGNVLSGVYDSTTHTITISQVTGDIIISASAKKLHTFNFYSMDGLTLHGTITAHSIKNILVTLVGNTRTIKIDGTTLTTYTVTIPSDYAMFGFATEPNQQRVLITTGYTFNGTFTENTNFYEVVQLIPVPTGDLSLQLYHNRSEKDVLSKNLQVIGSLSGTLRESCNIINPSILIEYHTTIDFDYVFIPWFNRYYYVTDIISVKQNLWVITLKVDVLMTYKDIIRLQNAFVTRNEYVYDIEKTDNEFTYDYDKELIIEYLFTSQLQFLYPQSDIEERERESFVVTTVESGSAFTL